MTSAVPTLYFDYVDPLSYLLESELASVLSGAGAPGIVRLPWEVCPPPGPMPDPDGPWWTDRWKLASEVAEELGVPLTEPRILPWTRKAHELVLHAQRHGVGAQAHAAVFRAMFGAGADIGRIDVLVEVAREVGLDPRETKAVLDVDRHTRDVETLEAVGREAGVAETPTLTWGPDRLQGFHNRKALRTFLIR